MTVIIKKIIASNFGPSNGAGYYETSHYNDIIEIRYVRDEDIKPGVGEYKGIGYYNETPKCDKYLTSKKLFNQDKYNKRDEKKL